MATGFKDAPGPVGGLPSWSLEKARCRRCPHRSTSTTSGHWLKGLANVGIHIIWEILKNDTDVARGDRDCEEGATNEEQRDDDDGSGPPSEEYQVGSDAIVHFVESGACAVCVLPARQKEEPNEGDDDGREGEAKEDERGVHKVRLDGAIWAFADLTRLSHSLPVKFCTCPLMPSANFRYFDKISLCIDNLRRDGLGEISDGVHCWPSRLRELIL